MCRPSENDYKIVKKFKEAGKILDIQLLDSIILTDEGYYSMCDEGEMWWIKTIPDGDSFYYFFGMPGL